jgi:prepilin-type processing-associated H-X9-DG protein
MGPPRSEARRPSCESNLKQIGVALAMYADAHQGHLPSEDGAKGLDYLRRENVLRNLTVFVCPSDTTRRVAQQGELLAEGTCSYVYVPTAWQSGTDTPVCWDKDGNHRGKGVNVLFNDCHVRWMSLEQWQKIKPNK